MKDGYEIGHTELTDLPVIFQLFDESIIYQEKRGYPVWRNYDKSVIVRDIESRRQYKIVNAGVVQIVFSVSYNDPEIWRERETGDSVYLHRIVVNPQAKGQKLFGLIVDWALNHINQKGLRNLRMDTWARNPALIDYYRKFGFEAVENYTTPDVDALPIHNRNLSLTLLEYRRGFE